MENEADVSSIFGPVPSTIDTPQSSESESESGPAVAAAAGKGGAGAAAAAASSGVWASPFRTAFKSMPLRLMMLSTSLGGCKMMSDSPRR